MLTLSSLRTVRSLRTLLRPTTSRRAAGETVTCAARRVSTGVPEKDARRRFASPEAPGQRRDTRPGRSPRSYCTARLEPNCWKCRRPLDDKPPAFFCASCKVVQPPEEGTSYFQIMDCDHTFTLDTQKLQKRYLQLQRSLHPDNFSQKSVTEQEYSESHSALVNKAYQTLLKPLSRGLYMLELEGLRTEEGTDSGADSAFLMELMEINEALDEAQTPEGASEIGRDMKGKLAILTEEIDAALLKGELQAAKALLAQMKYYANIAEKVKEKLSEFM